MTIEVLIRVEGGHVHRATKVGASYRFDERCNVDDAVAKAEIPDLAEVDPWSLCAQPTCFPPIGEDAA